MTISASRLPLPWDSFDVYLFDIDGTLIHCTDATHYFAFCEVLTSVAGRPVTLEGVAAHGNTDVGILRDAFSLAGVKEDHWRPRLPEIKRAMCDYVQSRKHDLCAIALPGVRQILAHLRGTGALLGVATGNLRVTGRLKLESADILSYFRFGGWSDAYEKRVDVFRAAVAQARAIAGPRASICIIGDTPSDISAGHQIGVPVIAVATGIFSFDSLCGERPDLCVSSLQELLASAQAALPE